MLLFLPKAHAVILINDPSFDQTIGHFRVFSNTAGAGTGLNYEMLKFSPGGTAAASSYDGADGSLPGTVKDHAPHGDLTIAELQGALAGEGITSARTLFIGFDVAQTSPTPIVHIDAFSIQFFDGSIMHTYTIGTEAIHVSDFVGSGSGVSEIVFELNLGFDFMTLAGAYTTDPSQFTITATHSNNSNGPEEYFLDTGRILAVSTVPEPSTMILFGAGMAGACFRRRKILK